MWQYILAAVPFGILGIVVRVLREDEIEEFLSINDAPVWKLVIKYVFKYLKHRRQRELKLDTSLKCVAEASDPDVFITSVTNHRAKIGGVRLDPNNIKGYKKVCGYDKDKSSVPVCYAETLFLRVLVVIATSKKFCVSPIGLIHVKQTIQQHEPLEKHIGNSLTTEAIVKQYRKGPRGVEVDIKLRLLATTRCIWEGVVTFLSRDPMLSSRRRPQVHKQESGGLYQYADAVSVSGDCGTAYARLTGDWNPHHLFPWTARLLGYKRPIAHGMWTLSRAMANIEPRYNVDHELDITCAFKRPLLLPGHVTIKYDEPFFMGNSSGCRILVEDSKSNEPHVVANVRSMTGQY